MAPTYQAASDICGWSREKATSMRVSDLSATPSCHSSWYRKSCMKQRSPKNSHQRPLAPVARRSRMKARNGAKNVASRERLRDSLLAAETGAESFFSTFRPSHKLLCHSQLMWRVSQPQA